MTLKIPKHIARTQLCLDGGTYATTTHLRINLTQKGNNTTIASAWPAGAWTSTANREQTLLSDVPACSWLARSPNASVYWPFVNKSTTVVVMPRPRLSVQNASRLNETPNSPVSTINPFAPGVLPNSNRMYYYLLSG